MSEINVDAALKAAAMVKKAIEDLCEKQTALIAERKDLRERIAELWRAPCQRNEAKQMVLGLVDLLAKDFPNRANWKGFFERAAFPKGIRDLHTSTDSGGNGSSNEAVVLRKEHPGPLSLADISTLQTSAASGNIRGMLGGRESGLLGGELDSATMESALCFFFGDRVKERVEKYFDSMFPEFRYAHGAKSEGLTLAERRNEIAEHESRIADIGKELSEIERSIGELKPPSANFGMSLEALRSL